MISRPSTVVGAWIFDPDLHEDDRGLFVSPYQEQCFRRAVGHPLFPVVQTNHSVSRAHVVRGVHFTATPPGSAKYVTCTQGRALDYIVDIRVGSPTYGQWEQVALCGRTLRSVYLPAGLGHAFWAQEDNTTMCYLMAAEYRPELELTVAVDDPTLDLDIPTDSTTRSERDLWAPSLTELEATRRLPEWSACAQFI